MRQKSGKSDSIDRIKNAVRTTVNINMDKGKYNKWELGQNIQWFNPAIVPILPSLLNHSSTYKPSHFYICLVLLSNFCWRLDNLFFLGATKHLCNWLYPLVGWSVCLSRVGNAFVRRSTRRTLLAYWALSVFIWFALFCFFPSFKRASFYTCHFYYQHQ